MFSVGSLSFMALIQYQSVAAVTNSLVAAAFAPFFYFLGAGMVWYSDARLGVAMVVMAGLLAWRHKANIQRLIQGKESRLGTKKKA